MVRGGEVGLQLKTTALRARLRRFKNSSAHARTDSSSTFFKLPVTLSCLHLPMFNFYVHSSLHRWVGSSSWTVLWHVIAGWHPSPQHQTQSAFTPLYPHISQGTLAPHMRPNFPLNFFSSHALQTLFLFPNHMKFLSFSAPQIVD